MAYLLIHWADVYTGHWERLLKNFDFEAEGSPLSEEGLATQFQLRTIRTESTKQNRI